MLALVVLGMAQALGLRRGSSVTLREVVDALGGCGETQTRPRGVGSSVAEWNRLEVADLDWGRGQDQKALHLACDGLEGI